MSRSGIATAGKGLLALPLLFLLGALDTVRADDEGAAPSPGPDYAGHVERLRASLPEEGRGFTIVVQPPFVVVGDGPAARVRGHAERTVKWAVDHLKRDYFPKDPATIIDVYLFKDDESYRRHAALLFGDEPTSPYGYYSAVNRAMVMNIATGGGTLVHEIVHAFVEANFPACPAWLNEGLGSLYEQCGERDGVLTGFPNWRLPILQRAIRAGDLPTFETLCGMTRSEFYGADRGTNYAQARYLLYYLQEADLLHAYYRRLVGREDDPTGYRTLVEVLEEEDMSAFQARWRSFVLELRFE